MTLGRKVVALQQQIEASAYGISPYVLHHLLLLVSGVQTNLDLQYRLRLSEEYPALQPTSPLSEYPGDWFVEQWNQNCQSARKQ